jgi:O-antigen ligase
VFPRYILDPALTTHEGRARGPFIEAAANGFAMYACGAAAVIMAVTSRPTAVRIGAALTAVLCSAGIVLTLTRSVWLSAAVAAVLSMLAVRGVRRWLPVAAIVAVTIVFATIALVPGLATSAAQRKDAIGTVYERQNLIGAAVAMTEARPLFGFGWATFETASAPYYTVSAAPFALKNPEPVHDVYASNLAEIGLVGTGVWLIAMMLALGAPLLRGASDEARRWQILLGTTFVFWLTMALASPMLDVFPHLILWTLGGVAVAAVSESAARSRSHAA